jgi:hypothetical protein
MKPVFLKALDRQIEPLLEIIPRYQNLADIQVPPLPMDGIKEAYKRLYLTTGTDFAIKDRQRAKSFQGGKIKQDEEEIFEDLIRQNILHYLESNAGVTISAVGDTSKELIQQLLRQILPQIAEQGIGGGAAQTMLRDMIASEWHQAARFRTERIVRTEVNRAANYGSIEGVRSTGLAHNKVWLAAFTAHSRQAHMDAEGQSVGMDESFTVGGEQLDYPGDPGGSAGNTINCLCSMTYELI